LLFYIKLGEKGSFVIQSFRRKNWWRAQNQNCKESFSARQTAALRRLAAGFRSSGIFDKIGSSEVIKILQD